MTIVITLPHCSPRTPSISLFLFRIASEKIRCDRLLLLDEPRAELSGKRSATCVWRDADVVAEDFKLVVASTDKIYAAFFSW